MKPYVLPIPKKYELKAGKFDLQNCAVSVADDLDVRVVKAAVKLKDALCQKTASFHLFTRGHGNITVSKNAALASEEYTLEITENAICIVGGDDAGCFYGTSVRFCKFLKQPTACLFPPLLSTINPI